MGNDRFRWFPVEGVVVLLQVELNQTSVILKWRTRRPPSWLELLQRRPFFLKNWNSKYDVKQTHYSPYPATSISDMIPKIRNTRKRSKINIITTTDEFFLQYFFGLIKVPKIQRQIFMGKSRDLFPKYLMEVNKIFIHGSERFSRDGSPLHKQHVMCTRYETVFVGTVKVKRKSHWSPFGHYVLICWRCLTFLTTGNKCLN